MAAVHPMNVLAVAAAIFVTVYSLGIPPSAARFDLRNPFPVPRNVSALFLFGDSIFDVGNNDYLVTLAQCNHWPYGMDFPGQTATGRWSNGYIVPDILAQKLGFSESPLPYLDPNANASAILRGVNFASGASGLLNSTNSFLNIASLSKQTMEWFSDYRQKISGLIGSLKADELLANSLFVISIGANDFFSLNKNDELNMTGFRAQLLQSYEANLRALHAGGARKVLSCGVPAVGCAPKVLHSMLTQKSSHHSAHTGNRPSPTSASMKQLGDANACSESHLNTEVQQFNEQFQGLLVSLNAEFANDGMEFLYLDSYGATMNILQNAQQYGFTETTKGCCGDGVTSVGPACFFLSPSCTNVSDYFFFDDVHPTQHAYEVVADMLFN